MRGGVAQVLSRGAIVLLLAIVMVGMSSCYYSRVNEPYGLPYATVPLLPGEQLWHGVPSYLFGTNDTQAWKLASNVDTMPQIQRAMRPRT